MCCLDRAGRQKRWDHFWPDSLSSPTYWDVVDYPKFASLPMILIQRECFPHPSPSTTIHFHKPTSASRPDDGHDKILAIQFISKVHQVYRVSQLKKISIAKATHLLLRYINRFFQHNPCDALIQWRSGERAWVRPVFQTVRQEALWIKALEINNTSLQEKQISIKCLYCRTKDALNRGVLGLWTCPNIFISGQLIWVLQWAVLKMLHLQ